MVNGWDKELMMTYSFVYKSGLSMQICGLSKKTLMVQLQTCEQGSVGGLILSIVLDLLQAILQTNMALFFYMLPSNLDCHDMRSQNVHHLILLLWQLHSFTLIGLFDF